MRVCFPTQALALLLGLRSRATSSRGSKGMGEGRDSSGASGAGSKIASGVGCSKHQIKAAALRLVEALVDAGYARAVQRQGPNQQQQQHQHQQLQPLCMLEVQHPLILYDALHRLGDYHVRGGGG